MKMPVDYTDIFQFFLHVPIAIFENLSDEEILEDCIDSSAFPIVIIKDSNHTLFKKLSEQFESKGVTQTLKSVVLAIGYNKPYLA